MSDRPMMVLLDGMPTNLKYDHFPRLWADWKWADVFREVTVAPCTALAFEHSKARRLVFQWEAIGTALQEFSNRVERDLQRRAQQVARLEQVKRLEKPSQYVAPSRVTVTSRVERIAKIRAWAKTGYARSIRQHSLLSAGELAEALSVSRSILTRWERGLRQPSGDNALGWLDLLERLEEMLDE